MNIARLSRFVLAHKRIVVTFWILITVASAAAVPAAVDSLSQDFSVPGREGAETSQRIIDLYGTGGQVPPLVPVVTLPEGTTVDSPGSRDELNALFAELQTAAPTARIASYASTADRAFVSDEGRTTFGLIFPPLGTGFAEAPEVTAIRTLLDGATVAGAPVQLTGYTELETGGAGAEESSTLVETLIAAGAALVILGWVFGSFLALVPLVMAGVSILATFLVILGLTRVADVSFIVEFIVALIGLGVAIDYALLIVTRWREEQQAGRSNEEAVQRAMETAGSAVVFSGLTVGVGLLALVVLPVPFLRSIGYGGMLIPLVSVLVAITLLPVVLVTIGPRIDWPRRRRGDQESRAWMRWGRWIVRRRWLAAAAGTIILAFFLVPALSLNVGDPQADALAQSGEAREGLEALQGSGIGPGVFLPFEVLATGSDPAAVVGALERVEGVRSVVAPGGNAWQRADTALLAVIPAADSSSDEGQATLERVREAAADLPGSVGIGGQAAQNADFVDVVYGNFPLMVALIAVVTFLLLVWAFRSLLLPLKALLLNIASIGAAYGVMVLVWQEGYGAGLIWGYEATGAITSFIPLVVFAFLFGLSMDYEVFILARMREEYDTVGDTDEAIVRGLGVTGRLVTSAALILFFAFASLASAPVIPVKVLATGLAAGILLDATVVRALLVPATVSLLGHWNWWLPWGLRRLVPAAHGAPSMV
ncbi:MAG: MMPL family transporter, partial [Chloroflexota bacterium]|nr:MMPL family transporter [Chloroflexota bacterium]